MAAKREYEAVLALGAKLQSSFGAAFGAAKKQLQNLGKVAQALGKSLAPVWKGFKLALGGLAAYAGVNIFKNLFGGIEEAGKAAYKRTQQLTAALSSQPELQKLGTDVIEGQVLALQKVSAELGKVGVVHSDHYEQASRTLALYGQSPAKIAEMLPVLGDTLTATKGVGASVEDMQGLVSGVTKAIGTGQVKALNEVGIQMDKNQKKAFAAMTPERRRVYLMEQLRKKYEGVNKAAAETDLGKIQQFNNQMATLQEDLGKMLIPMQAQWADFWKEVFPIVEPLIKGTFGALTGAMGTVATFGKDIVKELKETDWGEIDWGATADKLFKGLGDALQQALQGLNQMGAWVMEAVNKTDWHNVGSNLSRAFFEAVRIAFETLGNLGVTIIKWIQATNWDQAAVDLLRAARDLAQGFVRGLTGAIMETQWGQDVEKWFEDIDKEIKTWPGKLGDAFSGLTTAFVTEVGTWPEKIGQAMDVGKWFEDIEKELKTWPGKIGDALSGLGSALMGAFKKAIDSVIAAAAGWGSAIIESLLSSLHPLVQGPLRALLGKGGTAKPAEVPGAQYGGIFKAPTVRQIAEAGVPEAVIPLQRSARSRGLLGTAAAAIGGAAGPGRLAGNMSSRSTMNFAPVINIGGNADAGTVEQLDRSLRSLADDFLARWNRSLEQEQRLSFS